MDERFKDDPEIGENRLLGRRDLLRMLGLGLTSVTLIGCDTRTSTRRLPSPDFPPLMKQTPGASVPPATIAQSAALPFPVKARSNWTSASPNYGNMNKMTPLRYVTVHHDGMDPFWDSSAAAGSARLNLIRTAHRRRGWGDIGYHFAIDRGGNIWECRPMGWQGAHVKDWNDGNIGIVVMGNFERQQLAPAQASALRTLLKNVSTAYRIPARNIRTHREWPSATACPGRNLQLQMNAIRA